MKSHAKIVEHVLMYHSEYPRYRSASQPTLYSLKLICRQDFAWLNLVANTLPVEPELFGLLDRLKNNIMTDAPLQANHEHDLFTIPNRFRNCGYVYARLRKHILDIFNGSNYSVTLDPPREELGAGHFMCIFRIFRITLDSSLSSRLRRGVSAMFSGWGGSAGSSNTPPAAAETHAQWQAEYDAAVEARAAEARAAEARAAEARAAEARAVEARAAEASRLAGGRMFLIGGDPDVDAIQKDSRK